MIINAITSYGYGDPQTWMDRRSIPEIESEPLKLNHFERKLEFDAWINFAINQYLGKTIFSRRLEDVLFYVSKSRINGFYYECKKRGIRIKR